MLWILFALTAQRISNDQTICWSQSARMAASMEACANDLNNIFYRKLYCPICIVIDFKLLGYCGCNAMCSRPSGQFVTIIDRALIYDVMTKYAVCWGRLRLIQFHLNSHIWLRACCRRGRYLFCEFCDRHQIVTKAGINLNHFMESLGKVVIT